MNFLLSNKYSFKKPSFERECWRPAAELPWRTARRTASLEQRKLLGGGEIPVEPGDGGGAVGTQQGKGVLGAQQLPLDADRGPPQPPPHLPPGRPPEGGALRRGGRVLTPATRGWAVMDSAPEAGCGSEPSGSHPPLDVTGGRASPPAVQAYAGRLPVTTLGWGEPPQSDCRPYAATESDNSQGAAGGEGKRGRVCPQAVLSRGRGVTPPDGAGYSCAQDQLIRLAQPRLPQLELDRVVRVRFLPPPGGRRSRPRRLPRRPP